ncbi:hypothetical protein [Jiella marina]|uniref:hypothetical protein n=1 Tax=Jiella sp. LLJ827 TaxID=2917712 RepID=UPI002100D903|nr:hypothetical protein [Jiella sp. LLJ827]MCQ0989330.1 hypothetical protein [Jiella sp. LLJ827]
MAKVVGPDLIGIKDGGLKMVLCRDASPPSFESASLVSEATPPGGFVLSKRMRIIDRLQRERL